MSMLACCQTLHIPNYHLITTNFSSANDFVKMSANDTQYEQIVMFDNWLSYILLENKKFMSYFIYALDVIFKN